jgi:hypothetical protein
MHTEKVSTHGIIRSALMQGGRIALEWELATISLPYGYANFEMYACVNLCVF